MDTHMFFFIQQIIFSIFWSGFVQDRKRHKLHLRKGRHYRMTQCCILYHHWSEKIRFHKLSEWNTNSTKCIHHSCCLGMWGVSLLQNKVQYCLLSPPKVIYKTWGKQEISDGRLRLAKSGKEFGLKPWFRSLSKRVGKVNWQRRSKEHEDCHVLNVFVLHGNHLPSNCQFLKLNSR